MTTGTLYSTLPLLTYLQCLCVTLLLGRQAPRRWKRGRQLGVGGFGQVFLCYDIDTGRELAVKQVHLYCASSDVSKVCNSTCLVGSVAQ